MSYTKKTWSPGDNILYTDFNNMEDGLDDLFNNNITLTGHKTIPDGIVMADALNKVIQLEHSGSGRSQLLSGASIALLINAMVDKHMRFESPSGTLADFQLKTINGVYPELHAFRHASLDLLPRVADAVVSAPGEGGEYESVSEACDSEPADSLIFVNKGTYNETNDIEIKASQHVVGSGIDGMRATIIEGNMDVSLDGDRAILQDVVINRTTAPTPNYAVNLWGHKSKLLHCIVNVGSGRGVQVIGSHCLLNDIQVETPNSWGIECAGHDIIIKDCSAYSRNAVIMTGNDNIVSGLFAVGAGAVPAYGVQLTNNINRCIIADSTFYNYERGLYYGTAADYNLIHGNQYQVYVQAFTPGPSPGANNLFADNVVEIITP